MAITSQDIVVLQPDQGVVDEAIRYALKSGFHTYDRMHKDAWKRVARIARGKVNELLIRNYVRRLGLDTEIQEKSYRDSDRFDFNFQTSHGNAEVDVKTFHVLESFVRPPRLPFSAARLIDSVEAGDKAWHEFYPMLIPKDYLHFKDLYIFAVSVEEEKGDAQYRIGLPWCAFLDAPEEAFINCRAQIQKREDRGMGLQAFIQPPEGMPGQINFLFERSGQAFQRFIRQPKQVYGLSSMLALRLEDAAYRFLREQQGGISICVEEAGGGSVSSVLHADRFYEIFPRCGYTLYLVGWITISDFQKRAAILPKQSPCYFYPDRSSRNRHEPGTKTENRFVLPRDLNPISTLRSF